MKKDTRTLRPVMQSLLAIVIELLSAHPELRRHKGKFVIPERLRPYYMAADEFTQEVIRALLGYRRLPTRAKVAAALLVEKYGLAEVPERR